MGEGLPNSDLVEPLLGIVGVATLALLITELLVLHFRQHSLRLRESRMAALSIFLQLPFRTFSQWVLGRVAITACAVWGGWLSPFEAGTGALWWVYGFIVYEFCYWLYHFLVHRVRLLWCGHAAHHSPEEMTLLVGTNANPIDSEIHLVVIIGVGCGFLGVPPVMVLAFNTVDRLWAAFLHSSEWLMPRGSYGFLGAFMQTPALHRVHHGRNAIYKDRNLAPLTQLWDRLLGTYQPLLPEQRPVYGITRRPDTGSVVDVHLGEYRLLWSDLRAATSLRERLAIVFGPPGLRCAARNASLAETS
jgi:sterol desaturase/sphingolipid hydroxylase (fatty acid hydroxylase superfamily)